MRFPAWLVGCLVIAGCAASTTMVVEEATEPALPTPAAAPEATAVASPSPQPPVDPTPTPSPTPMPTPGGADVAPTAPDDEPALVLPFGADAPGIVTTTGVPVAVLAGIPEGLVVRTPCGRSATIPATGRWLDGIQVVLDPGHGGPIDTGAVGANGLIERDLNLRLALVAASELEARGITVALTRSADYATTLPTRAAFADHLDAELMVSIHHNAPTFAASPSPGTEVFVQSDSPASTRLGGLVYAAVFDALDDFDGIAWSAAPDAGVLTVVNSEGTDAYGMIRRPDTVTVLAELAYISNPVEAELLATGEYLTVAGRALADAIEQYLSSPERTGRGFQPGRVFNPSAAPGEDDCVDPPLS